MRRLHRASALVLISSLVLISFLVAGLRYSVKAQEPGPPKVDTKRAIETYQQGDATKAIHQLEEIVKKHPDDADAWYYLGLAFTSQGGIGKSRRAFEQVVRLRPDFADAHAKLAFALILGNEAGRALTTGRRALELGDKSAASHYAIAEASFRTGNSSKALEEAETALKIDPNFAAALITQSFAYYQLKQYSEAAASLERLLAANPADMDADSWRSQAERMRYFASKEPDSRPPVFSGKEVTQRARVLSKPEPQYTEVARQAGVEGTVVLRTVFSADGEVKEIYIVRALGYGLTTRAIRAARQIRFSPAIKDGQQVSMYIQLEYNFNLY